jgi:hypothetical protein
MKTGVCGIACEKCPMMVRGTCPNGERGCTPGDNKICKICSCAYHKGIGLCFECAEFPCETTREGPISYGFCTFISGKAS